jgi:hypothetical protein
VYTGGVEVRGLTELVDKVQKLDRELRKEANTELRQGAKNIALRVVSHRHQLLGGSGIPQEWAIVERTRPKYDRYVALQVPGAKPKLSGLRKTNAARAKSLAVAVQWGSADPRLGGPPRGALVGRNVKRLTAYVYRDYEDVVARVLRRYGLI